MEVVTVILLHLLKDTILVIVILLHLCVQCCTIAWYKYEIHKYEIYIGYPWQYDERQSFQLWQEVLCAGVCKRLTIITLRNPSTFKIKLNCMVICEVCLGSYHLWQLLLQWADMAGVVCWFGFCLFHLAVFGFFLFLPSNWQDCSPPLRKMVVSVAPRPCCLETISFSSSSKILPFAY